MVGWCAWILCRTGFGASTRISVSLIGFVTSAIVRMRLGSLRSGLRGLRGWCFVEVSVLFN
jgi:hypothetical protein